MTQKLSGRFDRVSAFPPYFTVDELWMYRKKKPDASSLRDNLKLEKGSFKFLKTEYMRQFKNFYELLKAKNGNKPIIFTTHPVKPLVNLNLEGHQEYHSQYKESYGKQWINGLENIPMEYETSQNAPQDQSLPLRPLKLGRRLLKKRPTLLKLEGEHYYITEYTDRYIKYAVLERTQLLRYISITTNL
ncbi:unnamed protein product [Acanthoscelides obtectus]|uniref:Uncharacterized protein n=1 Tax=Acanthoscelides obtectus TaxID=200917 RepID=A0A9P0K5K3_ACAOB|nr:unnamed protein product [Acanthoscelides obtectus]CAK1622869.1 hypothetical protein AOBTE_LOCUS1703 [Acanthoscelides obtectus]